MAKSRKSESASAILEKYGEFQICEDLLNGKTFLQIAQKLKVSRASIHYWIQLDIDRSARVREARVQAAAVWDEMATEGILKAKDAFELAKAREMAHHYRWRAAKVSPKDFGEFQKVESEDSDGELTIHGGLPL